MVDPGLQDPGWVEQLNDRSANAVKFFGFLGNGILEQGFTLRHQTTQGSAAMYGPVGLQLGAELATFPFMMAQVNNIGKEENTMFSPVLPRFMVAWTDRRQRLGWGIGFSLTPPIVVGGASALVAGIDGSVGYDLSERWRVGAELDVTVGRADAPVAATMDQKAAGQLDANTDEERYESVCMPQKYGCIDVLNLSHGGLRLSGSWHAGKVAQPYIKLGIESISDHFFVQVDTTTWRLYGWLPDFSIGTNLLLGKRIHGLVGGTTAYVPTEVATQGRVPLLIRFDASIAYTF